MNSIEKNELFSRWGFTGALKRSAKVLFRYGITKRNIYNNLKDFCKFAEYYDFKITIPFTALTLKRHSDILNALDSEIVDVAIHGLKHIDYTSLGFDEVFKHLKTALEIFKENGLNPAGFRAPYLKINEIVLNVIKKLGLKYDSSFPCFLGDDLQKYPKWRHVERNLRQYSKKTLKPNIFEILNIKEFPVILPDDVILVDLLSIKPGEISKIWIRIIERNLEENSIFVIQIHPERFQILKPTLERVVEFCMRREIKLKSISELVKDLDPPALAITGDVDIISIWDIPRVIW